LSLVSLLWKALKALIRPSKLAGRLDDRLTGKTKASTSNTLR